MGRRRRHNQWRVIDLIETKDEADQIPIVDLTNCDTPSPSTSNFKSFKSLSNVKQRKVLKSFGSNVIESINDLSKRFGRLLIKARGCINSFLESPKTQTCEIWNRIVRKENEIDDLLKRRQVSKNNFPDIPSDFSVIFETALNEAESSDYIVTVGRCSLGLNELDRLCGDNWFNDQIIDGYLYMISARSVSNNVYPKVHSFNSYFYNSLNSAGGYSNVVRFTTKWKIDIFSKEILFIPICTGVHWTLGCINMKQQRIYYYDSLGGNNKTFFALAKDFLCGEYKKAATLSASSNFAGNFDDWPCECPSAIPRQRNGFDCGLFVCIYAEYLSRSAPFDFNQQQMPYFRERVKYELFSNKLLIV